MKKVIPLCDNLQYLHVKMEIRLNNDINKVFCSPNTLESLNFVQRKLETFKINLIDHCSKDGVHNSIDYETWKRTFIAIFPNVTCYSSELGPHMSLECTFSKELNKIDKLKMSSVLAYLLFARNTRRKSLDVLSTMRLVDFLLRFYKISSTELVLLMIFISRLTGVSLKRLQWCQEDCNKYFNFKVKLFHLFTLQKNLKTISVQLCDILETQLLKSLMFHILDNCCHLHDFEFCWWNSEWMDSLTKTEVSRFNKSILKLNCILTGGFQFKFKCSSLSLLPDQFCDKPHSLSSRLELLVSGLTYLQHLDVKMVIPDETLQKIFEFLVSS